MTRFIGITREQVFSPGRVDDDRAILVAAADHLRRSGREVTVLCADDDQWPAPRRDTLVFTMAQGARALERLAAWQARGARVVNTPAGILNCQRHRTVAAFSGADIAFPETVLLAAAGDPVLPAWIADGGAWVKRGDVHATESDDVVFAADVEAARAALRRFTARGIRQAVVQRHVPGIVVKFYAVRGRFFFGVPPLEGPSVPAQALSGIDALGQRAARVLDVEIYGGDCVYGVNGRLTLIDLNDWPSYARCRAGAAKEIAAYLLAQEVATDT